MLSLAILAAVTGEGLIASLIYLVILGLIFYAIWWFIGWIALPDPFNKIVRVIIGLFALIAVINFLLSLIGKPFVNF